MNEDRIYIIEKLYIRHGEVLREHPPLCACADYDAIVKHAKELRDNICGNDFLWFDYDQPTNLDELLVKWDGFNYYSIGLSDATIRITFRICSIPLISNTLERR